MAGGDGGGVVLLPWYATLFRGDKFADALQEIAPLALRYGAVQYDVLRARDDTYKYLHLSTWEKRLDWERYWYGPEFQRWRADYQGWFQVPIVYAWHDRIAYTELGGRVSE